MRLLVSLPIYHKTIKTIRQDFNVCAELLQRKKKFFLLPLPAEGQEPMHTPQNNLSVHNFLLMSKLHN